MTKTYVYTLHTEGPALWPEHKPLAEVLDLEATTPEWTWEATYQGNASPPGGSIYRREWWLGINRYDPERVEELARTAVGRWLTFDTAMMDTTNADFTGFLAFDLLPDHRLLLREADRKRLTFADLPKHIEDYADRWNYDHKLMDGESGVIIESKASGISAYQTLHAASSLPWLADLLIPWDPGQVDKIYRARQASVWCKNGCILLPMPSYLVPWLLTFENELFAVPSAQYMDMADAFSQLVIYLEHVISAAWHARRAIERTAEPAIIGPSTAGRPAEPS